jgi:8-oxo-dGTP pyrophosphatase MutT (NUDIX family)
MRVLVRLAMTALQQLRRAWWFAARPATRGVHAAAFTDAGNVILVRHSYAPGWRLPGGGVKSRETPEAAALRELEEEIGLCGWREIRRVLDFEHRPDFRRGAGTLFRLDGVRYTPRRSLEIEEIGEFDPADLPTKATALTRRLVEAAMAGGDA